MLTKGNKMATEAKKPTPKSADASGVTSGDASTEQLIEMNAKLEKLIEIGKAVDWKLWVYLKANNYID